MLYSRFSKGDCLCRVYRLRSGRINSRTPAKLRLLSTLIDAMSPEADLACCTGGNYDLVQVIDNLARPDNRVHTPRRGARREDVRGTWFVDVRTYVLYVVLVRCRIISFKLLSIAKILHGGIEGVTDFS